MKTQTVAILCLFIAGFLMTQCNESTQEKTVAASLSLENMRKDLDPAKEFYEFVNGAWLEKAEIPADRGRWGSFDELRKRTDTDVLSILGRAGESDFATASSDQRKAADFFQSGMDTESIERVGMKPIESLFEQIENIESVSDLQTYLEDVTPLGGGGFFGFGIQPDLQQSDINAAYLGPGDLGLPDRDYYTKDDDESKRLQGLYKDHVARMMGFLGHDEQVAKAKAEAIYNLEKEMAENMLTKEARRNIPLLYNKRSVAELANHTPSINWPKYLENIGAGTVDTLIVTQPKFMDALEGILNNTSPETWRDYLAWSGINGTSRFLNSEIEEANFDFYGKEMQGTEEMRPREERVLQMTNGVLGEALGKLYVGEYFPEEAKVVAKEMVEDLLVAFEGRIKNLDWMSDETKEKALEKLSTFNVKIGYPDKWKDYSGLDIKSTKDGGSYVENVMEAQKHNFLKDIEKIGKKVDKTEWFMPPQVVNAYYNPLFNEIVFPAAILQPPFFYPEADAAINYGGMGAVIGHEISHGFDDMGSRFDASGNMINWWTDQDRENFDERNDKLIAQFDSYAPFDDLNVNGEFTLGENIGDLGGLNTAYDALQLYFKRNGKPELIDGFTPEQRFFLSWGTIWRTKYRDEALKTQIKTDPHSPGMYRAIGAPSNMQAFYDAFNVPEDSPMYRPEDERVYIW